MLFRLLSKAIASPSGQVVPGEASAAFHAAVAEDAQRHQQRRNADQRRLRPKVPNDLAAVPLPCPLGASAPSLSASGVIPQLAGVDPAGAIGSSVGGWFWCAAATTAAAWQRARHGAPGQGQRENPRRRGRRGAAAAQRRARRSGTGELVALEEAVSARSAESSSSLMPRGEFQGAMNSSAWAEPAWLCLQEIHTVQHQQQQCAQFSEEPSTPSLPPGSSTDLAPTLSSGSYEEPSTPSLPLGSSTDFAKTVSSGSYEEIRQPMQLWPATPESTPPQSPRIEPCGNMMPLRPASTLLPANTPAIHIALPIAHLQARQLQAPGPAPRLAQVQLQRRLPPQTPQQVPLLQGLAQQGMAFQRPSSGREVDETAPWWTSAGADLVVAQLNKGDAERKRTLVRWIIEDAWSMATRRHGCRVVQAALDAAEGDERLALADHLRTRVVESLKSPHANHVLQRCIVVLPSERLNFVLEELQGRGAELARHRFGCRVLERIIEHCSSESTAVLVDEVLASVADLCRHEFGNYVVQHILEFGGERQRAHVAEALMPHVYKLAKHRVASHVVEKALLYCSADDKQLLMAAMSEGSKDLASLGRSLYGSFVVRHMSKPE